MAKSVEEQVLDKKTKEQIRQELLEVINTKVKDEIVETVANDVRESFDQEKKEEIKEEISRELVIDIKDEINKEQKKLTRRKSFKIFRLHIYILALIAIVVYLVYLLYLNGGLDILNKYKVVENTTTTVTTTNNINKDLSYYVNNYGYLVDSLYITNLELLKGSYSVSDIDITDKLAMVYNKINDEDIKKEGIIYTVSEESIKNSYIGMFGSLEGYKGTNFSVNGISYAYQESTLSYIAVFSGSANKNVEFYHVITGVRENNDSLVFTTKVGIVIDDKVYNVYDLTKDLGSKEDVKSEDLSEVQYTFKKVDNKYYIYNISKK